jgi:hypothetical protein
VACFIVAIAGTGNGVFEAGSACCLKLSEPPQTKTPQSLRTAALNLAWGGIEPPTQGFSILENKGLTTLIAITKIYKNQQLIYV